MSETNHMVRLRLGPDGNLYGAEADAEEVAAVHHGSHELARKVFGPKVTDLDGNPPSLKPCRGRRLVAAWNAAEGLTTEELERMEPGAVKAMREAVEAALLFHSGTPWTVAKSDAWWNRTQSTEVTTKALCDALRAALARAAGQPGGEV